MNEPWNWSAAEIGRAVAAGEISAREVMQAHLARIDAVNPQVNAITARFDEALTEADRSIAPARTAHRSAPSPASR